MMIAYHKPNQQQLGHKREEWKVDAPNIEIPANHEITKTKNSDGINRIFVEKHYAELASEPESFRKFILSRQMDIQ